MKRELLIRTVAALALTSVLAVPALATAQTAVPVPPPSAQGAPQSDMDYPDYGPEDGGYDQGAPDHGRYDQGYDQGAPQGAYRGPPPPHHARAPMRPEDREYAQKYRAWERERHAYDQHHYANCVRKRQGGALAGAVIGGIAGAVIGSNVAGRYDRTEGAVAGGALGAIAGGAIGSSAGSSSCPPGYIHGPRGYYGGPAYVGGYYPRPYYGGPYYGGPVIGVGVGYGWGPRYRYKPWKPYRGWRHGYWRRW